jgi:hypothetical protein
VKHVISLTMTLAFASLVIAPNSAGAVDLIGQSLALAKPLPQQKPLPWRIEIGGSSSTTISVPESTTTIDNFPRSNTFDNNNNYPHDRRRHRQPTVIIQQNNIYPGNSRSNCTTTIIGSPIPSPIPLDRTTGQPCR